MIEDKENEYSGWLTLRYRSGVKHRLVFCHTVHSTKGAKFSLTTSDQYCSGTCVYRFVKYFREPEPSRNHQAQKTSMNRLPPLLVELPSPVVVMVSSWPSASTRGRSAVLSRALGDFPLACRFANILHDYRCRSYWLFPVEMSLDVDQTNHESSWQLALSWPFTESLVAEVSI